MNELTQAMSQYRECLKFVWNGFFAAHADWDERDNFDDAAVHLFRGIVLYLFEQDVDGIEILPSYRGDRKRFDPIRVKAANTENINFSKEGTFRDTRDLPPNFPIDGVDLRYFELFDFYELGPREFQYVKVEIASSPIPEQTGMRLLIPFENALFEAV